MSWGGGGARGGIQRNLGVRVHAFFFFFFFFLVVVSEIDR